MDTAKRYPYSLLNTKTRSWQSLNSGKSWVKKRYPTSKPYWIWESCFKSRVLYGVGLALIILFGQSHVEAATKYAGEFLTLGVGARPLGMGGSFVAISDDATATYWNPAGLGSLSHSEVSFMHSSLGDLNSYDFINYVQTFGRDSAVGLSWLRVGVDDIPITNLPIPSGGVGPGNRPEIERTFSNTDNAFILSYGRRIGPEAWRLFAGGNAKVIYISTLRNFNAVGFGGDFGILWQSDRDKANQLSIGVMAQDFFKTKLYWNTPPDEPGQASNTDTINPNFKIGFSYSIDASALNSRLLLTVDTDSLYSFEMHYGAEYVFAELLALRAGLQERKGIATTRLMTAGAGLKLSFLTGAAFSVDYAYLGNEDLGASNRISLMTRF